MKGKGMNYVVYGPRGCGKTRNKERIASALGCTHIFDGASIGTDLFEIKKARMKSKDRLLVLTADDRLEIIGYRKMSFADAMATVKKVEG